MGFMAGSSRPRRCSTSTGPVTAKSYNKAVRERSRTSRRTCSASRGTSATCRTTSRTTPTSASTYKDGKVVLKRQVLHDRGRRQGDRPDPRLGEEVQAEHGEVDEQSKWRSGCPGAVVHSVALRAVRRRLGVLQAVHRARPRARRGVRALRRRDRGAVPGNRGPEPRLRRHRRRGRPDRLLDRSATRAGRTGSHTSPASRSAGSSTSLYGVLFGPAFAARDPLVKMMGTLALALILLGVMAWRAPAGGAFARFLTLPSSSHRSRCSGPS